MSEQASDDDMHILTLFSKIDGSTLLGAEVVIPLETGKMR